MQLLHAHPPSGYYLGIYAAFGLGQCLFTLFNSLIIAVAALIGAKALHNRMLDSILHAPMAFFDTTPLGRILNRFSKDVQTIDEIIPQTLASFLNTLFTVVSTALVIIVATPMFTIVIIPLVIIYFVIQVYWFCCLGNAFDVCLPSSLLSFLFPSSLPPLPSSLLPSFLFPSSLLPTFLLPLPSSLPSSLLPPLFSPPQRYYVSTSRQLQRIESVSRSPIYSHFQESVQGATSIRAYRLQGRFVSQNEQKVDHSQLAYYPTICSNRFVFVCHLTCSLLHIESKYRSIRVAKAAS